MRIRIIRPLGTKVSTRAKNERNVMHTDLRTALLLLSVLFFLFAGFPPAPQRLSVAWQWWAIACLVVVLFLLGGKISI